MVPPACVAPRAPACSSVAAVARSTAACSQLAAPRRLHPHACIRCLQTRPSARWMPSRSTGVSRWGLLGGSGKLQHAAVNHPHAHALRPTSNCPPGNVIFCEPTLAARETTCARVLAETGATMVPPYGEGLGQSGWHRSCGKSGRRSIRTPARLPGVLGSRAAQLAWRGGCKPIACAPRGTPWLPLDYGPVMAGQGTIGLELLQQVGWWWLRPGAAALARARRATCAHACAPALLRMRL